MLFGAIGGALVPLSVLPQWAKTIAPLTPTYWAMRGFRSVILDGAGLRARWSRRSPRSPRCRSCSRVVALRKLRFDDVKDVLVY